MQIKKINLYSDIYGLYNYFLEKGSKEGLTIKDFRQLRQLEKDISYDLIAKSEEWSNLHESIHELIHFMYYEGLGNKYNPEVVAYLRENATLLPLVLSNSEGEYKTEFIKPYSDDSYMFLCQFHREKTPSMGVVDNKNYYYCFGCGSSGTPIEYLMEYESLSFKEAVSLLGKIYLIDLQEKKPSTTAEKILIEKYQNTITSSEYLNLLKRGEKRIKSRHKHFEELYAEHYSQIERVKKSEYDPNFTYKKPLQKIYLNKESDYYV